MKKSTDFQASGHCVVQVVIPAGGRYCCDISVSDSEDTASLKNVHIDVVETLRDELTRVLRLMKKHGMDDIQGGA
jgi:hypothetical protein